MLERAKETTRNGKYTYVEYARFADDLVVLIDAHPRNAWLLGAVNKRLREEFAKLQVEINEEKSRIMDLDHAESFCFLGFDFRRLRSMEKQVWRAHYTPKMKKRTALLRKLKDVFRRYQSQPMDRVVHLINPVLRGWVNYFAVGHSSGVDGGDPVGGLTLDEYGNLFGATTEGGNGHGVVFELIPSQSGWIEHVIYTFQGGSDGSAPYGALTLDDSGNLYGTTCCGGSGILSCPPTMVNGYSFCCIPSAPGNP